MSGGRSIEDVRAGLLGDREAPSGSTRTTIPRIPRLGEHHSSGGFCQICAMVYPCPTARKRGSDS